jgi:hypothetical protein
MKFFLDTEFIERGSGYPLTLLSIGIVAENGREFYAVHDTPTTGANQWVIDNVLPHLGESERLSLGEIKTRIMDWVSDCQGNDGKPEFWGYFADYDWVVFCQIFGTMIDLPKGWPMYCRDLKQWCDQLGNPRLPPQDSTEHNALNDARWNRKAFEVLVEVA